MQPRYYPSLLSADFSNLADEVSRLDPLPIAGYHADLMDGRFVPNFALGLVDLKAVRNLTRKPIEAHLMIEEPERYIQLFARYADMITVHCEATPHADRALRQIKELGKEAGIALNPGTPVSAVRHLLNVADYVLVMGVNPGFPGQEFIPYAEEKVVELRELIEKLHPASAPGRGLRIHVDGGMNPELIGKLLTLGAQGFVLGASSLFLGSKEYGKAFQRLP